MDPLLPFRALSPGTCKSKIPSRKRDTKLSLRPRKPVMTGKIEKENKPPSYLGRRRNPDSSSTYSDLITSDESNVCDPEDIQNSRRNSVMTMNSQESTFSLPAAESTRCEIPLKMTGNVKSTNGTLCTVNSGSSSVGTEYFTACPVPTCCDDSIIYISDSSPEPEKKVVSTVSSVLITSDESDSEPQTNNLHQNVMARIRKGEPKRLCDTVILETSHSEDSDSCSIESRPKCGIVIPPSIKSDNNSCSNYSAASSFGSTSPRFHLGTCARQTLCNKESEASRSSKPENEISDEGVSKPGGGRGVPTGDVNKVDQGHITELKHDDLSWKDDFHLVLQESSAVNCEDSLASNRNTLKTLISGKEPGTISKEKYNDIARWLFSGSNSPESRSEALPAPAKDLSPSTNSDQKASTVESDDVPKIQQHPQIRRLSIVEKSSFGSESDDSFNALVNSIKKKRNDTVRKATARKIKDDSFIHDSSDTDESPSPSVYYSDLTKSIRKEVASVHKSVKKMTKRYIPDSSDESDEDQPGSPVLKPVRSLTTKFKSTRIPKVALGSDDSDSESPIQERNTESALDNIKNLDAKSKRNLNMPARNISESPKLPAPKPSIETKGKRKNSNHKSGSGGRGSGSSNSDCKANIQANLPTWRKGRNLPESVSNSSTSSDSHDEDPKGLKGKCVPIESFKKPISVGKCIPDFTPKKVAALRSPLTSQSPIRTFLSSLSGPSHNPGVRDHPESVIYNRNFKAKKEELTRRLFKLFNREVFDHKLPGDMLLEWNSRLARTAGLCYCKLVRKGGVTTRTAKIALSTKVITSPDRLRDTLIHEMCHAAVWLLNNVSGGHGQFWKAWSHKAMKRFPELPPIERCHSYKIETKYTYKCTKCGYSFGRHSKSLDMEKKRCGYCYGQFEVFLTGKDQEQKGILKTPKAPNAFALFVKENYGLIKQENVVLKHADIMKKLSENFAAMKVKNSGS